jgi:gluconolactonase
MGAPNDLVFGPDGRLWVTDTGCEIDYFSPDQDKRGWIWSIDMASGATEFKLESGPVFIKGLRFSPDGTGLILTTTSSAQLWGYRVEELPEGPAPEVCAPSTMAGPTVWLSGTAAICGWLHR